jgi:predicted RNA-binding Zn-ribbon protein involved in translation (DUF1610 family)
MGGFDPMSAGEEIEPCLRCGHDPGGQAMTVCPRCGLREISPCPGCGSEVPRVAYARRDGDLFECPSCGQRVRLILGFEGRALRARGGGGGGGGEDVNDAVIRVIPERVILRRNQQRPPRTGYRDTRTRWAKNRCE